MEEKLVAVHTYLTPDERSAVNAHAKATHESVSHMIARLLRDELAQAAKTGKGKVTK